MKWTRHLPARAVGCQPLGLSRTLTIRLAILLIIASNLSYGANVTPGTLPPHPIAFTGATLHTLGPQGTLQGVLLIDQGKIVALGEQVAIPSTAVTIDVAGRHIYPGLFQAHSDLGLVEISSVRATLDQQEAGAVNPNVKAQVAINPDSELLPVTRANGVLLALSVPDGPLIQGSSVVLQLDGWTWEEMTVRSPAAVHVQWPTPPRSVSDEAENKEAVKAQADKLKVLDEAIAEARLYYQRKQASTQDLVVDLRWESLLPLLEKQIPLVVAADDALSIQQAVAFCQRHQLRCVISGGYEAPLCADLLKQMDVPVIVSAIYRLPARPDAPYDEAYTLPERLRQQGVRFCIAGGGRFEASNARNLPYHAATAVAYGLPPLEGLKAITLYPAQILGVSDRLGTLEPGKDATLIVTTGNPLETETNVQQAYIQGKPVDLSSRHKQLWDKYQRKALPRP